MDKLKAAFALPVVSQNTIKLEAPVKPPQIMANEIPPERRTVFVGNIERDSRPKEIKKLFKQYGDIETVRFRSIATKETRLPKKAAVILKDHNDIKDTMNAYIVFKSEDSVANALNANAMIFKDRHLRVDREYKSNKPYEDEANNHTTIFVGNLPFDTKEESLWKHFSGSGEIEYVRIIRDNRSQVGKGIAYIKFKTKEGMQEARKLDGSIYEGRNIRVKKSTSSSKLEKKSEKRINFALERIKAKKIKSLERKLRTQMTKAARKELETKIVAIRDGTDDSLLKNDLRTREPAFRKKPIKKLKSNKEKKANYYKTKIHRYYHFAFTFAL